jgi:hypothetical protein
VLQSLSQEIRECREHAQACARRAEATFSDEMRQDLLQLEQSWLRLAQSYEFVERVLHPSHEHEKNAARWRGQ